jgi:hypothetical protein
MSSVLSVDRFNELYAPLRPHRADLAARLGREILTVDRADVPEVLWPLIPYAEFWDCVEDGERGDLLELAGSEVRQNLCDVFEEYAERLNKWLGGPEAAVQPSTSSYLAFSFMHTAGDWACNWEYMKE